MDIKSLRENDKFEWTKRGNKKDSIPEKIGEFLRDNSENGYTADELLDELGSLGLDCDDSKKLENHLRHYNTTQFKEKQEKKGNVADGYIIFQWVDDTRYYNWQLEKPIRE